MDLNAQMLAIGELLRTQDNRCTSHPMFCVQVRRRDIGYSADWCEEFVWLLDGEIVRARTRGASKVGFKWRWETVMVAFTEKGCKDYLRSNGHNLKGKVRIFAESFYRCLEMIEIREWLMLQESA